MAMSRYIDADKFEMDIVSLPYGYRGMVRSILSEQPTADVVEVVRCKDCKYATGWTTKNGLYGGLTCESLVDMDVDEDFFCANGERRE